MQKGKLMNIKMIVAMDRERAIGKAGKIPWHLKADIDHFASTTTGKVVVMGRKTYQSLPNRFRPLPERQNIVLTRSLSLLAPGCEVLNTLQEVLQRSMTREVWVMGGAEIYQAFLPYSRCIMVTHVGTRIGGDIFFPAVPGHWAPRQLFRQEADEKNDFSFSVTEYTRR